MVARGDRSAVGAILHGPVLFQVANDTAHIAIAVYLGQVVAVDNGALAVSHDAAGIIFSTLDPSVHGQVSDFTASAEITKKPGSVYAILNGYP